MTDRPRRATGAIVRPEFRMDFPALPGGITPLVGSRDRPNSGQVGNARRGDDREARGSVVDGRTPTFGDFTSLVDNDQVDIIR
jgi:hypothetical protein